MGPSGLTPGRQGGPSSSAGSPSLSPTDWVPRTPNWMYCHASSRRTLDGQYPESILLPACSFFPAGVPLLELPTTFTFFVNGVTGQPSPVMPRGSSPPAPFVPKKSLPPRLLRVYYIVCPSHGIPGPISLWTSSWVFLR